MANRKSLSKKIRFEVFKRDSFKCQYCGKSSPDVILEVDHIKPVSEGGTNDITNLITACFDCNRGKTNILLDDNAVIEKQRKQLEELNERRNQLKMMMEWREGLQNIEQDKIDIIIEKFEEIVYPFTLNDKGVKTAKKMIKKFDLNLILDCIEISTNQYLKYDSKTEQYTSETVEKSWKYIEKIATNKLRGEEKPYLKDLYYIRGILKNRLSYLDLNKAIKYLELAHVEAGYSIESLKELSLEVKNWTDFRDSIENMLEDEGIEY